MILIRPLGFHNPMACMTSERDLAARNGFIGETATVTV